MARIGGAFPLPPPQPQSANGQVALSPGGIFYFPAGNYVVNSGGVSVLQIYDGQGQQWRGFSPPSSQTDFVSVDGYNYRLINLSGVITGALITNAGSGATNGIGATATGVSVAIAAPSAGGPLSTATAYPIIGGSVQAPTITQGGQQFLVPPLVVIDPPPLGGLQATAIATINGAGVVTGITMTFVGAGYTASPNFYLIPQFGLYVGGPSGSFLAGAAPAPGIVHPINAVPGNQNTSTTLGTQLTPNALTGTGTLTGIVLVNNGFGYTGTTIPAITITGAGAAAATAIGSFSVTGITAGSAGAGYTGTPPIWDTSLGVVSGSYNNNEFGARGAQGVTTINAGAVTGYVIEDPGFGLQKVPSLVVINSGSLATGQATATAVIGGVNDVSFIQQAVQ